MIDLGKPIKDSIIVEELYATLDPILESRRWTPLFDSDRDRKISWARRSFLIRRYIKNKLQEEI